MFYSCRLYVHILILDMNIPHTSCSKNKGQPLDSSTAYDFLYLADQDTVQQTTSDEPPAEPSKETPDTTDATYASVLSTSEQSEQQINLHISPPVENGYASPDIRDQPEQPQLHPSTHAPPTCSYSYVLPPDSSQQLEEPQQHAQLDVSTTTKKNDYSFVLSPEVNQQPEEPQQHTPLDVPTTTKKNDYSFVLAPELDQQPEEPRRHTALDAPTTTKKNDYSFVLPPEVNQQPEEPQHQASIGATLETIGGAHNDPEQPIYQNIPISNKHSPEPPEVAVEHVYATVIMQNKKKPRSAEVPTEKPSAELLEPANSPTLQPVPPNPIYSGENKLHIYLQ